MNNKQIEIKNFGIIKKAHIDIAPLNIFIGSNSSGKSFIARLIHCFDVKNFNQIEENIYVLLHDILNNLDYNSQELFDSFKYNLFNFMKSKPHITDPFKISIDDFNLLIGNIIFKYLSNIFEEKIEEQFDLNLNDLINFNESFFEIKLNNLGLLKFQDEKLIFDNLLIPFGNNNDNNYENQDNVVLKFGVDENNILIYIESFLFEVNELKDLNSLITLIFSALTRLYLYHNYLENSYYLLAERSDLISDNKALRRRIQDKSYFTKNQIDVFNEIYNIDSSKKGDFYDLACEFEKEFSGISVDIKNNGVFNEIIYNDFETRKQVPSKILSTSIHEISLFSLYLKYILKKDDLLIIEEPEAHLHPKNQRILVKYIVRAVNLGLKVMFTTHSDYVIEQVNNFIRMESIDEEFLKDFDYGGVVLDYNDVSIYNFEYESKNLFKVDKIDINETGFDEESFTPISEALYDETDRIIDLM